MAQNNGWFQLEPKNSNKGNKSIDSSTEKLINEKMQEMKLNAFSQTKRYHEQNDQTVQNYAQTNPTFQNEAEIRIPANYGNALDYNAQMQHLQYAAPAPETYAAENTDNQYYMQAPSTPWSDNRVLNTKHSQTVGERGPVLLQDSTLHEALETFISEKIPERPVHVKGFGAFGFFQTVNSMKQYTKLSFLQMPGQQVPVIVRFSLAAGNKGTPDTARNVRGFATKFYTPEGVFDLLCNHIPVLFVRDGIRFPEAFTSLAPSPVNNLIDPERFWKFVATAPEATHFVTWLYSDVGTVKSLRHIQGHSVNTYVWKNSDGVRRYVKYHWIPVAGEEYITRNDAIALAGINPDIAGKDLFDTIAAGIPVQYELWVQLMNPGDENRLPYDPLDCTKIWDEQKYPLLPVGVLTLNCNPDNYMEQVEKAAFAPTNLLPGAELSDDKLLQARANIYWDSQRRRLGENFRSIPVNHQENWTPDDQLTSGAGTSTEGRLVRSEIRKPDNFTQAGERYRALTPEAQNHLVDNIAADLAVVSENTRNVVLGYLHNASAEMGQRIAAQIPLYSKQ